MLGKDFSPILNYFFRLINKLLKQDGKSPVKFQTRANSPFIAMTNIECFNDGAMKYGLAQEFTFQSGDLYEVRKGGFYNVINCLHSLGFVVSNTRRRAQYWRQVGNTGRSDIKTLTV